MAVEISLAGRTALITGASKNIGAATARLYAEAGADLALVARGSKALEEVAAEIRSKAGRKVFTVVADVATREGQDKIIDEVTSEFGHVDILVNNAHFTGDTFNMDLIDIPPEVWSQCVAVNITAPVRLSQAFGRKMLARERGVIINVLTTAAFVPTWRLSAYGSTKAALWQFTRYLASELAPHVRVNAVCPGSTQTEESFSRLPAISRERVMNRAKSAVPIARLGKPEENAWAYLYMASDASSYTTGDVLFIDGGRVSAAGAKT